MKFWKSFLFAASADLKPAQLSSDEDYLITNHDFESGKTGWLAPSLTIKRLVFKMSLESEILALRLICCARHEFENPPSDGKNPSGSKYAKVTQRTKDSQDTVLIESVNSIFDHFYDHFFLTFAYKLLTELKKGLSQALIFDKVDGDLVEVAFWAKLSSNKQAAAERQPIRGKVGIFSRFHCRFRKNQLPNKKRWSDTSFDGS